MNPPNFFPAESTTKLGSTLVRNEDQTYFHRAEERQRPVCSPTPQPMACKLGVNTIPGDSRPASAHHDGASSTFLGRRHVSSPPTNVAVHLPCQGLLDGSVNWHHHLTEPPAFLPPTEFSRSQEIKTLTGHNLITKNELFQPELCDKSGKNPVTGFAGERDEICSPHTMPGPGLGG